MWYEYLNQDVTLWRAVGRDAYGQPAYNVQPVNTARWEDRLENVRTTAGDEVVTKAVVWLPSAIEIAPGDYIALGTYTDITDAGEKARKVVRVDKVTDIRALRAEKVVYVV